MRLFLLPVSTRRSLLLAQCLDTSSHGAPAGSSLVDRSTAWAARKWAQWEKYEAGWQRKVVDYGNQAFRRIPFEEWSLKSVPPLPTRRRRHRLDPVDLVFPRAAFAADQALAAVLRLATERLPLHRRNMFWCIAAMPLTIPFALIPIIPNMPFFYLVYRTWSHWRAIAGARHLQWLVQSKLVQLAPSTKLNHLYNRKGMPPATMQSSDAHEEILLTQEQVRDFSITLDVPALEIELERAVWQVDRALKKSGSGPKAPAATGKKPNRSRPAGTRRSRM